MKKQLLKTGLNFLFGNEEKKPEISGWAVFQRDNEWTLAEPAVAGGKKHFISEGESYWVLYPVVVIEGKMTCDIRNPMRVAKDF